MASQDCLLYFAQKDGDGFPIPSTMQGYNPRISLPCQNDGCNFIQLTPSRAGNPQPNGTQQCMHPNNLRYFYRLIPYSSPVQLQPNSLISAYDFPKVPNDCWWVEWRKWC